MVAGAVAGQAAKAAAGKTASGVSKAAGKSAEGTAQKRGRFGIQTPSQERQNSAGNFLNKNESKNNNENEEQDASSNEMNYTGNRQNSSRDGFFKQNQKKKGKLDLKKLKTASPLLIGLLLIVAPLLLVFGTGSLLFADIDENTQESMDIQYLAMRKVAQTAVKIMLQNGSLPSTFAETLTENGLEVGYLDANGTFIAGLRPNSENSIALASSSTKGTPKADNSLVLRLGETIIDADSWDYFAETNKKVYSKFNDATYGRAAGHYDTAAEAFYSTINASRNIFSNYTNSDTTDFREILGNYIQSGSTSDYDVYDAETCSESNPSCSKKNQGSSNTQTIAIDAYLDALFDNTLVGTPGGHTANTNEDYANRDQVQATTIAYLVNTALNANETYESMKYFLTFEEVMSKTKAGDGSNAPINPMLNFLTTEDENGISAVQSDTLSSVLTKSFSSYSGEKAKQYSIDRVQSISGLGSLSTSAQLALATTGIDILNNSNSSYGAQDKSSSMIKLWEEPEEPIEPKKEDFGCTTQEETPDACNDYAIAHADWQILHDKWEEDMKYKTDKETHHEQTQSIISELQAILSDASKTTYMGEKGNTEIIGSHSGELFSKGASILGSRIATFGEGGTIGTEESIAAYQKETNKLLAWEAEVERSEKSPFDISSQNTFLGSIAHSFSSYLYTSTSLSSFSNIVKNSFSSLLPGVFADNESSFQTTYGDCPEGKSTYACSVYSYPEVTFNLSSIENYLATTSNDEEGSNVPSTYDDYEKYNNLRSSNFGYVNFDLAKEVWDGTSLAGKATGYVTQFFNFLKNKATGSISDYFSTYYDRFSEEQLNIITGTAFINANGTENEQAYCAYSRFLDQIGYFSEENTNTAQLTSFFVPGTGRSEYIASLENYAEEFKNLSDTEYLARISGISEDEANLVLGYITYNSYLASINHDSALAFGRKEQWDFETSNQSEPTIQLAIFNSEAKTINSSSKRRETTYVA